MATLRVPIGAAVGVLALVGCASNPIRGGTSIGALSSIAPVTSMDAAIASTKPALRHCEADELRAVPGDAVSPATGEHPVSLDIINTGPAACWLMGYPRLRISDAAGRPLPLTYHDGGGYVTPNPPASVSIAPGGRASVVFANYRCDLGDKDTGTSIEISFPDVAGSITAQALGDRPMLGYCGPGDPGDVVDVSPVEPDIVSALFIPLPPSLPNSFPPGELSK